MGKMQLRRIALPLMRRKSDVSFIKKWPRFRFERPGVFNKHSVPEHKKKYVILIAGPTAVGKTSVAIRLAKHFGTAIISADSRQCFKELKIGVARPSKEELLEVPHHFIASHSIQEEMTAAGFEQYALKKLDELFHHHTIVLLVGGTGLYIKAFCEGLDGIPAIDPAIRQRIIQEYESRGLVWLQGELKQKDPAFFEVGEIMNPQRLMRALEVIESTGQSILSFQKGNKAKRDFNIIKIGLELPKEALHRNINTRVNNMMDTGLLEEVRSLLPHQHLNALQTVGYNELFDFINGKTTLETAIEKIKTATRQYAKRQKTWFKKDKEIQWFRPGNVEGIISFIEERIKDNGG